MFNKFFNKGKKSNDCIACTCPRDMHKEHTHDEKGNTTSLKCEMCGREHKSDSSCDCGCK